MRAHEVFLKNKADLTKQYYEAMNALGPRGELAVALLRALKRSKRQTGFGYRRISKRKTETYDHADAYAWAITELIRVLLNHADWLGYKWGWLAGFLYIDLPTGQVHFTCEDRSLCPDHPNPPLFRFDGSMDLRVIQFCDSISDTVQAEVRRRVTRIIRPQSDGKDQYVWTKEA